MNEIDRDKDRIRKTGEVFTPPELVNEMLDHLRFAMWEDHRTFLDPACGDGNMLVEVLKRKLSYGHNPDIALRSIFGIDIMPDNIDRCRHRLLDIVGDTEEHRIIVEKNIRQGSALNFDWNQFDENPLLEY
jgi:SAM-dependent methyltransferase